MHAQNTLVNFGEGAAVSRVIVRDLEGTVVFMTTGMIVG